MYAQANIGRNVPQDSPLTASTWSGESEPRPMRRGSWESFTHSVGEALVAFTRADTREVHDGVGEWEGVPEESRHVSVFSDRRYADDGEYVTLCDRLADLARNYSQAAIFLVVTFGESGHESAITTMIGATK